MLGGLDRFRDYVGPRWIVVLGVVAGAFVFVADLASARGLVVAFFLALAAFAAVSATAGVAHRLWRGAEVSEATLPGGVGVSLEPVQDVRAALDALRERLQSDIELVNQRLYDLDNAVFGESVHADDEPG